MNKIFDSYDLIVFCKNGFYIKEEDSLIYLGENSPISIENTNKKTLWLDTSGWNQTYHLSYYFWSKFKYLYITCTGYPIDLSFKNNPIAIEDEYIKNIEPKYEKIDVSTQYVKLTLSSYFSIMDLNKFSENNNLVVSSVCLGNKDLSITNFKSWFFDDFINSFSLENELLLKLLDLKLTAVFPIESWTIYTYHSLKILELISVVNYWKDYTNDLNHLIALLNVDSSSGWAIKCKAGLREEE